jgi:hypothetical protein
MAIFYKVDVRSEYHDLSNKKTKVIIQKGLIYAKEIATNARIMMCDNKFQGTFHDYYVLSTDFIDENIATLKDVQEYLDTFTYDVSPVYSKKEERETKKLIKSNRKRG